MIVPQTLRPRQETPYQHFSAKTDLLTRAVLGRLNLPNTALAEHVPLGRHEELSGATKSGRVRIPPHHGQWDPVGLAHHELGGGGDLVGHREYARLHRVAVRVFQSPVVRDGVHAGDADGDVRYAVPPGPSERVRDHHGHLDAGIFGERVPKLRRGGVRVHREQADGVVSGDVRGVYASVGADEAVVGLRDDDAAVHAYDAAALAQHHLDLARVLPVAPRVALRERGRLDRAKVDQAALGLTDDLVRHDEHVARAQVPGYRTRDHTVQVVAGTDLRETLDTQHLDLPHEGATPDCLRWARSPAVSRSKARWGRSQTLTSRPRPRAAPRCASKLSGPKAKGRTSGGRIRSPLVPERAPSGEIVTDGPSRASSSTASTSSASRSGRSAGSTRSGGAPSSTALRGPSSRAGLSPRLSWTSGVAPRLFASSRTIRSGLTTQTSATPASRIARTTRPIMYRVSPALAPGSRTGARRLLVPRRSLTGTTA